MFNMKNMNPVRAGMSVCVFLGVHEYVSVNESRHVRVKCKCDCQNVYICNCVPYVIVNKFAIVVLYYGPFKKINKYKK